MLKKQIKVKVPKVNFFSDEKHISVMRMLVVVGAVALLGGFLTWKTFASESVIANVQAETLTTSGGVSVITARQGVGEKALMYTSTGTATGKVSVPSTGTRIAVSARGKTCNNIPPKMVVRIDDNPVLSTSVSANSWASFSATTNMPTGVHTLSISYTDDQPAFKNCSRKLFVDQVNIYGDPTPVAPAPTLAFSASPNTLDAGQSSTLTWTSTNATSCTAGGTWSGDKPMSGSVSTGALNVASTYTLTCLGTGGTAKASVTVGVTAPAPTSAPDTPVLPKQGISTGYKVELRSPTDRAFELDKIKRVFNGKPGYVRLDDTTGAQSQLETTVTDVLSRGMTPFLTLHGTTGTRPVDNFGHDQAVKWAGKASFFEIANEPDLNGWTPDGYADFVKGTAASVKSGNPKAVVIAGALFNGGSNYTTQDFCKALATRAKGSFDMLSLHLYDDPTSRGTWNMWDRAFPSILGTTSTYKGNTCREILDANGLSAVPIISTESGGPVYKYGDAGQSTIVGHDFDALKSGLLPSIAVYTMKNDDVQGFGLLDDNNNERPAYATFMSRAN